MSISEVLAPATKIFSGGLGGIAKYGWVLFGLVIIVLIVGTVVVIKKLKNKKAQWTHKLKVRRVLDNNLLSNSIYINMRRFPIIKNAEIFELETPLLGGYLIPELDRYSGENEYSIILDSNNRIYTNLGEYFNPDDKTCLVSAKHSAIDLSCSQLKSDFQNINKVSKRIEWATIAKYAFMFVAIICTMIVIIVGITKWGNAQEEHAKSDQAQAQAMLSLSEAMKTVEATVNTQKLEILPMMKELYGNNIQGLINTNYYKNGTI